MDGGAGSRLLTSDEFADQIRRSPRTLTRWRKLGKGPVVTWVEGRPLYAAEHIREWLAGCTDGGIAKGTLN